MSDDFPVIVQITQQQYEFLKKGPGRIAELEAAKSDLQEQLDHKRLINEDQTMRIAELEAALTVMERRARTYEAANEKLIAERDEARAALEGKK
jgi:hypothetical protein